jgi:ankyrin repeat protein
MKKVEYSELFSGRALQKIRTLLKKGYDINTIDEDGWSLLTYATNNGNYDVVRFLLENEANINIQTDETNRTALIIATEDNDTDIVWLLLKYGADVDIEDCFNKKALTYAKEENRYEIIELLENKIKEI